MKKTLLAGLIGSLILSAGLTSQTQAAESTYQASERARQLAQQHLIVDTHIDVPYRLVNDWEDVTKATQRGDFDYPRAVAGGLNAPFMSIYIPAAMERSGEAYQLAHQLIDSMEALVARAPEKFALAYDAADLAAHQADGLMSIALGMENGAPISGSLDNLAEFYQRGIRYITLAHSESNHISDSSYDIRRQWNGLSPFGKTLVAAMNDIGMMIDVSHISDEAFWQVMELSEAPVIASHSSLRRYTPGFERNMSDEMIKALADNGGVIMINFGSTFVTQQANRYRAVMQRQIDAVVEEFGEDSAEAKAKIAEVEANNPFPYATLDEVLDHIDYVVNLVGIEHVGIGSDYDGVGDSLPVGLKDVSTYPNLVQGLLDRDYSEADIEKILGTNLIRVWQQVEAFAAQ